MDLTKQQEQFVKDNIDFHINTLLTLAQIPAPSNFEEKRAEYCFQTLTGFGAEGVYVDDALNVIYPYHCENAKDIFVLSAHTDVVFPDTEPLPLKREGSIASCPGIGDDTSNAAIIITLAKYLAEVKPETKDCGIILSLVSGEEGLGNLKGIRALMKQYGDRVRGVVSLDTAFGGMVVDAVGSERYKVTVKEKGGHSWGKFGEKNAIAELSSIIAKLYEIEVPKIEGKKTSYNVGMIEGGISVNTIAPLATMLYEYRSDSAECLAVMREKFNAIIEEARKTCSEIIVETVGIRPCSNVDPDKQAAFLEKLVAAQLPYLDGKNPSPRHSSTDCNIPLSMGIPSGTVGTNVTEGAHTRGEWLNLDYCERAVLITFRVLADWLA